MAWPTGTSGQYTLMGIPGHARASCNGNGTLEILAITQQLEKVGISCCVVGISACKYFGAAIARSDWEICVPSASLKLAFALFNCPPLNEEYEAWRHDRLQLSSLLHTFPRLKKKGVNLFLDLIPSSDCHILCQPSNFERSRTGLPYPKLKVFVQSLLDTNSRVHLTDVIDGMGLTSEWGARNLDLTGSVDVKWAEEKNRLIRESVEDPNESLLLQVSEFPESRREVWEELVASKESRIDIAVPEGLFVTRFRTKDSGDPRLEERDYV